MKSIVYLLLLISPAFVFSQEIAQDFGTWSKLKTSLKINKKTLFSNKTEIRTFDNSRQMSQFYTQFSINKKLNKKITTSFAWRFKVLNEEFSYIIANRFHNDLNFKHKFSDLSFNFRLRTQINFDRYSSNDLYERTRLKMNYKINKKIAFYIYQELYFLLSPSDNYFFNKTRFGSGIKYELNKKTDLEIKYLKINDINVENPISLNVLGLKISHQF
ncbi:MAG: DUF2490 domain-containing protein [Flavobacteriales bacterium]|mgnify:FL=1|jgi:hypothetical protein|tara:strand:+ start:5637 stop:6284 length:648 start_codon:yes stop_codon:yes gene_type:complete